MGDRDAGRGRVPAEGGRVGAGDGAEPPQVEHREKKRRFTVETDAGRAYLAYTRPDERTIELKHTVVPKAAEGRGIGGALARTALTYAREHELRVVVSCPFVTDWLARHPDEAPR